MNVLARCFVIAACLAAPTLAAPVTYVFNFITDAGIAPGTGSFSAETTTGTIIAIDINWNSFSFTLGTFFHYGSSPTLNHLLPGGQWMAETFLGVPGAPAHFGLSNSTFGSRASVVNTLGIGGAAIGTFTVTPQSAAPEPSTLGLLAIGSSALALRLRKRKLLAFA